jgi:hypothetical protein
MGARITLWNCSAKRDGFFAAIVGVAVVNFLAIRRLA